MWRTWKHLAQTWTRSNCKKDKLCWLAPSLREGQDKGFCQFSIAPISSAVPPVHFLRSASVWNLDLDSTQKGNSRIKPAKISEHNYWLPFPAGIQRERNSAGGKHLGGHFWQRDKVVQLCSLSLCFRLCSGLSLFLHDAPQNSGIYTPSPFLGPPFVLWKPGSLGGCATRGPVRSCQVRQLRVVGPAGLPGLPFPLVDMQRYFFRPPGVGTVTVGS